MVYSLLKHCVKLWIFRFYIALFIYVILGVKKSYFLIKGVKVRGGAFVWVFILGFCLPFQSIYSHQPSCQVEFSPQTSSKIRSEPWLTGPLLAPVGTVVPYGSLMVKPYLYFVTKTGMYNKKGEGISSSRNFYSVNAQFLCFFGLTPWCDLNLIPQIFYQFTANQHSVDCGDLTVGLDFQLMDAGLTPYFPGIKLAIREIFPTGKFQNFSPRRLSTDHTGEGTFATQFDLVFYKVFHLHALHWLSTTFSAQYTVNTPVNVHGFNAYGGGFGTRGKALVGNSFQSILSFELTLNQNWVFSLDTVYKQTDITHFFGIPGISFLGTFAHVGKPSSELLSLAPAIEYNFSKNLGLIGGAWISVFGRNSSEFLGAVLNLKYVY